MMITEKEIFEKYPKIFADKDKPKTESCMCWGVKVPKEWYPILDDLCYAMQNHTYTLYSKDHKEGIKFPQVVAEQVKSKFNDLRFYYRLEYTQEGVPENIKKEHSRYIDGMIALTESRIFNLQKQKDKV